MFSFIWTITGYGELSVQRVSKISMSFLVALYAKGYQVLSHVITQSAPRLNVMDLKSFHSPARLAAPAVSL